jgi:hypothetical protein
MKRAQLKKMLRDSRPSPIRPEMFDDSLIRRMLRMSENARLRYEKEKRKLYDDRSLTDKQRSDGVGRALDRYLADWKRREPLEREYEQKHLLPLVRGLQESRRSRRARSRAG